MIRIYIYLDGQGYKHDVYELIRVFIHDTDLKFIKEIKDCHKDLIKIEYMDKNGRGFVRTRLYIDKSLVSENIREIFIDSRLGYDDYKIKSLLTKNSIYKCLYKYFEINVPWGILTGIRPMKIVHDLLDMKFTYGEIENILEEIYLIDKIKIEKMFEISRKQRKHIEKLDNNRYSIYIGIPFCPSKCSYCTFPSFVSKEDDPKIKEYVDTLLYEMEELASIMEGKVLNTVYIGGGTPTAISAKEMRRIFDKLYEVFPMEGNKEFTVEAGRPDSITREKLELMKEYMVDRISINPQTMKDRTLRNIKRLHDKEDIISVYTLAKEIGFDIINMDIILGLPGEGIEDIEYTLSEISRLGPKNLTIHTLAMKRGSQLSLSKYEKEILDEKNIIKLYNVIDSHIKSMDLEAYYLYRQKDAYGNLENIGYGKKGYESIYNIVMMEERETVIGMGLGSVSKIYDSYNNSIKRVPNFKGLLEYNTRIEELINEKREILQ